MHFSDRNFFFQSLIWTVEVCGFCEIWLQTSVPSWFRTTHPSLMSDQDLTIIWPDLWAFQNHQLVQLSFFGTVFRQSRLGLFLWLKIFLELGLRQNLFFGLPLICYWTLFDYLIRDISSIVFYAESCFITLSQLLLWNQKIFPLVMETIFFPGISVSHVS